MNHDRKLRRQSTRISSRILAVTILGGAFAFAGVAAPAAAFHFDCGPDVPSTYRYVADCEPNPSFSCLPFQDGSAIANGIVSKTLHCLQALLGDG